MWFGASVGEGGDGRGRGGDVGEEGGAHDQGPSTTLVTIRWRLSERENTVIAVCK